MTVILQLTLATLTLTSALGLQTYPQMFHFECPKGTCKKKKDNQKKETLKKKYQREKNVLRMTLSGQGEVCEGSLCVPAHHS